MSDRPKQDSGWNWKEEILPVAFMLGIIVFGYHGLFSGESFFADEDCVELCVRTYLSSESNGWDAYRGLGSPRFFADPGNDHVWSMASLLTRLYPRNPLIYNISIVLLLVLATLSQYAFLRAAVPGLGRAACILALLVVFSSAQQKFYFQRHWIALTICTPLYFLMLSNALKSFRLSHYFKSTLVLWFAWFFGSFLVFAELLCLGGLFTVAYCFHFRPRLWPTISRFVFLSFASCIGVLILGAWIFYSFLLEGSITHYVRTMTYVADTDRLIDWKNFAITFIGLFHSGWLPGTFHIVSNPLFPVVSWSACAVVFPLVLLVLLGWKSKTSWEAILIPILIILYINEILTESSPAFSNIWLQFMSIYPMAKFMPAYHTMQVALIGLFLTRIKSEPLESRISVTGTARSVIAFLLTFIYVSLAALVVIALICPGALTRVTASVLPDLVGRYEKEVLVQSLSWLLDQIRTDLSIHGLLFYSLSALSCGVFMRTKWISLLARIPIHFLAAYLLVLGLLLSWSIYPLNENPLLFEQKALANIPAGPTTRYYSFEAYQPPPPKRMTSEYAQQERPFKYPTKTIAGDMSPPGLSISRLTSYIQADIEEYFLRAFAYNGPNKWFGSRRLAWGPLAESDLVNMAAVSHYFSRRKPPEIPDCLELISEAEQLVIYRNKCSWPYFYLAKRVEVLEKDKWPRSLEEGTVYVDSENGGIESLGSPGAFIRLESFRSGRMVFHYGSDQPEILVVADAWHAFWRAKIGEKELPVIRVNKVFKGVKLPPGENEIILYFDNTAYLPGIPISIAGWTIFVISWVVVCRRERRQRYDGPEPSQSPGN